LACVADADRAKKKKKKESNTDFIQNINIRFISSFNRSNIYRSKYSKRFSFQKPIIPIVRYRKISTKIQQMSHQTNEIETTLLKLVHKDLKSHHIEYGGFLTNHMEVSCVRL
jgi:hypothetical protein